MKRSLLILAFALALAAPVTFAQATATTHAAVGTWTWPGGARRVLRADRVVEVYDARGAAEPAARYIPIDPATVDIKYADGHFARARVQADGSLAVTARSLTGEVQEFRVQRAGSAPPAEPATVTPPPRPPAPPGPVPVRVPAPADSPLPGVWHHLGDSRQEPVVVLADGTLFTVKVNGRWTYDPASRQLRVTWDQSPARMFLLSADGERVVQSDGTNQWRRWTEPVQRLRNRTILPAGVALTNLVVGDWCRQPDAANGLYVYGRDGQVVKYENAARERVANRARYYLFRDDALLVVRWPDTWRDYLPLPPGRRDWKGWNNRGDELVRLRHNPR